MADPQAKLEGIIEQQQSWADQLRIELANGGNVRDVSDNLFLPLHAETRRALLEGSACGFGDERKPDPLHALHSSQALACNFFEPWRGQASSPLDLIAPLDANAPDSDALEPASAPCEIVVAEQLPLGPHELTVAADVVIRSDTTRPAAVVACFTEGYDDVDTRLPAAPSEYAGLWSDLPGCRGLAEDLHANPRRFRRIPAGRILELALALHQRHGSRGARLVHLWYDTSGRTAREQRQEADRLRMRIGGEVDFASITWQTLFLAMLDHPASDPRQIDYLAHRYFAG
jgi:hypothetical protein